MWTFEPSAALAVLEDWEKRDGLDIRRGEWLDREQGGVTVAKARIMAIRTLSEGVAVQDVDYGALSRRLKADGQVFSCTGSGR